MSATIIQPRKSRVQRSELAVPATSPHFFEKAAKGPADAIFLDLEDAVAPEQKYKARKIAIEAINDIDWGKKTLSVRVNGLDTRWGTRDIIDVAEQCPRVDMILLPMAGTPFDIKYVETILTSVERDKDREKKVGIEILIETALGMSNVEAIAASSDRLEAMIFGVGDYSISMRTPDTVIGRTSTLYTVETPPDYEGEPFKSCNDQWHFALARMANACRAYGLRPIDGPYADFSNPEGYRAAATRGLALGFEGKWAIHPSQVSLANEVYAPTEAQVAWAHRVLAAIVEAKKEGKGAFSMDGQLVDMAHEKLANNILSKAVSEV